MPVGGALDTKPVDVAGFIDIAQPRYLGMIGMAVTDQRMLARRPKPATKGGDVTSRPSRS